MTSYPTTRLCYVTQPEPGTVFLNMQFDADQPRVIDVTANGTRFERVQITHEQLCTIAADAVAMAMGWKGKQG